MATRGLESSSLASSSSWSGEHQRSGEVHGPPSPVSSKGSGVPEGGFPGFTWHLRTPPTHNWIAIRFSYSLGQEHFTAFTVKPKKVQVLVLCPGKRNPDILIILHSLEQARPPSFKQTMIEVDRSGNTKK